MTTPGGYTVHTEQNLKVTGSLRLGPEQGDASKDEAAKKAAKKDEAKAGDKLKTKAVDKQQLCIDLLMVGCVQSFIDFFYITHRKLSSVQNPLGEEAQDVQPAWWVLKYRELLQLQCIHVAPEFLMLAFDLQNQFGLQHQVFLQDLCLEAAEAVSALRLLLDLA